MATAFEHVTGLAFTRDYTLHPAEWAVKGVKLQHEDIEIDTFACARVVGGQRTYPRVLRLGTLKDETMVQDHVWRGPRDDVYAYDLPINIEDFSDFFRGEPQPWKYVYYSGNNAPVIRGIYRAILRGGEVPIGENMYHPTQTLTAEDLGTPPTYVL